MIAYMIWFLVAVGLILIAERLWRILELVAPAWAERVLAWIDGGDL